MAMTKRPSVVIDVENGYDGCDVYSGDDGKWEPVPVDRSESDQLHFSVNLGDPQVRIRPLVGGSCLMR